MKFEDDLVDFVYSLTNVKKPIEKRSGIPHKYILSKDKGIILVKDDFVSPGEVSENDKSLELIYWRNEIDKNSNMNTNCIIEKEE